jgi:hypothetical protein
LSARLSWRRAGGEDRSLALVLTLGAASAAALAPWMPLLARLAPACVFHALTGVPCPACGTTRAVLALAQLDPRAAIEFNPLVTVGLVVGFVLAAAALPWVMARGPVPVLSGGGLSARARGLAAGVLVAQWAWLVARGV